MLRSFCLPLQRFVSQFTAILYDNDFCGSSLLCPSFRVSALNVQRKRLYSDIGSQHFTGAVPSSYFPFKVI